MVSISVVYIKTTACHISKRFKIARYLKSTHIFIYACKIVSLCSFINSFFLAENQSINQYSLIQKTQADTDATCFWLSRKRRAVPYPWATMGKVLVTSFFLVLAY